MKFNIIIPTYKRVEKLSRCINSILKQTYRDFEIIVCFDNMDMASSYAFKRK